MGQCRHVLRLDAFLAMATNRGNAASPLPAGRPLTYSIAAIFLAILFTEFARQGMQLRIFRRPPIGLFRRSWLENFW
jgi:hypothetical protein